MEYLKSCLVWRREFLLEKKNVMPLKRSSKPACKSENIQRQRFQKLHSRSPGKPGDTRRAKAHRKVPDRASVTGIAPGAAPRHRFPRRRSRAMRTGRPCDSSGSEVEFQETIGFGATFRVPVGHGSEANGRFEEGQSPVGDQPSVGLYSFISAAIFEVSGPRSRS